MAESNSIQVMRGQRRSSEWNTAVGIPAAFSGMEDECKPLMSYEEPGKQPGDPRRKPPPPPSPEPPPKPTKPGREPRKPGDPPKTPPGAGSPETKRKD